MSITTKMSIPYPDEWANPYWTAFDNFADSLDGYIQANQEDESLFLFGGEVDDYDGTAETLSFKNDLKLVSSRSGNIITITAAAGPYGGIAPGDFIYVTTAVRPITNQTLLLSGGTPSDEMDIIVGYVDATTDFVYFLNHLRAFEAPQPNKRVKINAATYTTEPWINLVAVVYTPTGACQVTLASADVIEGREITVVDEGGNASVNNITIDTEGVGETIIGAANYTINGDYNAVTFYSDGKDWFIK